MAFHRFRTPILLVEWLFFWVRLAVLRSRLIASWVRLVILSVRFLVWPLWLVILGVLLIADHIGSLSFFVTPFRCFVMSFHRFDIAAFHHLESRGYNSNYITWSLPWFHGLIHEVFIHNLMKVQHRIRLEPREWHTFLEVMTTYYKDFKNNCTVNQTLLDFSKAEHF